MEFDDEEELQDFLISFLQSKGVRCQKEFPLSHGWRVDILTAGHIIECKLKLTLGNLDRAANQVRRYRYYLQDRQLLIAGLATESGRNVIPILAQEGIQVWFIDEVQEICDYYDEFYEYEYEEYESEQEDKSEFEDVYYSSGNYSSSSYDESSWIGPIAAAVVLIVGFAAFAGQQHTSPVRELHRAAMNWDTNTANRAISRLKVSDNECEVLLGNTFEWEVRQAVQQGAMGNEIKLRTFNRLNVIQDWLMQEYPQCKYPPLIHPDQFDE